MTRVLLTGGSGFVAAHVLDELLKRGHSVVATVRSQAKGDLIKKAHPEVGADRLETVIVEDIAKEDAFDKAVVSEPPFEAVIHTASPFHYNIKDTKKDLLDPAIIGTTAILRATKRSAPTVKRVVVTSSFAAILDPARKPSTYTYSEADWNGVTMEEAVRDPSSGYRASKTFAERAAWDFVEQEKPNFDLVVCNPPLVLGPVVPYLNSLDAINTSNARIRDMLTGAMKAGCAPTGVHLWIDVRDLAVAHALCMEKPDAGGKRFFLVQGLYSNREIVEIVRGKFPEYADRLPTGEEALKPGDYPADGGMGFDNSLSKKVLGIQYSPLEQCIVDTVHSLKAVGLK